MLSLALALGSGLLAGLAASPHCLLMCGSLQQLQRPAFPRDGLPPLLQLHAGRILGYALLGGLAGAVGVLLLRGLPTPALGLPVQALAALLLVALGLRRLRRGRGCAACPSPLLRRLSPFLRGLLWAALPCGALYAMLFLAAVSGGALYGALLLAAFGLGTLPLLGSSALLPPLQGARRWPALLLVGLGLVNLAGIALGSGAAPVAFCLGQP